MTHYTIDTVLFDLDGTLVDTEPAAARAVTRCFQAWGIQLDPKDAAFVTGRTWASAFQFLFGKYKLPLPAEKAAEEMMEAYRSHLKTHLAVVPGSVAAVTSLAAHFPLGLVSGSNRAEIHFALDQLGVRHHFQVILGAEDYPLSKPAPDGYVKALQILGKDPKRTLIFEDSTPGIASALAAGAWVVAISGTNHFQQDTSRAHFQIPDLTVVNRDWISALKLNAPQMR